MMQPSDAVCMLQSPAHYMQKAIPNIQEECLGLVLVGA